MKAITVVSKKVPEAMIEFRMDSKNARWSVWLPNKIVNRMVRFDSGCHLDEVIKAVKAFKAEPDRYAVTYHLI